VGFASTAGAVLELLIRDAFAHGLVDRETLLERLEETPVSLEHRDRLHALILLLRA
jgi:hypothetical protein